MDMNFTDVKFPFQNQTLRVIVVEGANILGRQTGLWSTKTKESSIVPKAAWH
jgi:hypothetical protein